MQRYIIERNFAEQLGLTKDGVEGINRINGEEGIAWIFSFLSADKKKTYCLYEAPSPEAIRAAARVASAYRRTSSSRLAESSARPCLIS
jgi:hypothetical protein